MPVEMKRQGQPLNSPALADAAKAKRTGGFQGRDLSPLSTYVTHKMLGSQKLRKRILDDAKRVAFYRSCAPVESATGKFRARSFFPDFVRFARISARSRGRRKRWGVGALGGEKGELSDWKK